MMHGQTQIKFTFYTVSNDTLSFPHYHCTLQVYSPVQTDGRATPAAMNNSLTMLQVSV